MVSGLPFSIPWAGIGSLAAASLLFVLVGILARHRGKPGATWFMAAISAHGLWCLAYGVGLFVTDPTLRVALECLSWLGFLWIGYLFLGFALDYTGRSDIRQSLLYPVLGVLPAIGSVLVVTNPWLGLMWDGATTGRVFDVVVLTYTLELPAYLFTGIGLAYTSVGILLLFETVFSYGPLYRREAAAVALSPVPPAIGLGLWVFGPDPIGAVNWGVVFSLGHAGLDVYAFVGNNMFETSPATQRVAEDEAIDTVPDPVVVLDEARRIVDYNDAAIQAFVPLSADSIGSDADTVLPASFEEGQSGTYVTVSDDEGRSEYAVRTTTLTDHRDTVVGYSVLFRDVTDEREREQRLEVLNRVLRHNLRNKLNVINAYAAQIADDSTDHEVSDFASRIEESGQDLAEIGEKARTFDRLRRQSPTLQCVDVPAVLASVCEDMREAYPEATITLHTAGDQQVVTDHEHLSLALSNLVENAIAHGTTADAQVDIAVRPGGDGGLAVDIVDDGPGIPDQEMAAVDGGTETDLEHGSGIGLWVAEWSIQRVGGDLTFEQRPDGTTVSVSLPDGSGPA